MPDGAPKRTIYDSVFCNLFQDPKYQLELYKTLHPEKKDVTVNDIKDVTLEEVFMDGIYNDLGFTVEDITVLLFEDQSRWSRNITARTLTYLGEFYHRYLLKTKQNYYNDTPVKLPKPELYMLYTGDEKHDEEYLSLADIYWGGDNSVLDLKVKVLYGNDQNSIITQYVKFNRIYKEMVKIHGKTREAVLATIKACKEQDVLREYLESHEPEVIDIMMALYNKDVNMQMFAYSKEKEGLIKGLAGLVTKKRISVDDAAEEAKSTVEDFKTDARNLGFTDAVFAPAQ